MSQVINYNGQLINLNGSVIANKFPIRDGLMLYVDSRIDASYPRTGTTVNDLSVSALSGTLVNGVEHTPNKYFSIDGVDDLIQIPVSGDATKTYTINCLARVTGGRLSSASQTYNRQTLFSLANSNISDGRGYRTLAFQTWNSANEQLLYWRGNGSSSTYNIDYLSNINGGFGDFHLYTVVYDPDTTKFYLNGELVREVAYTLGNNGFNKVWIGTRYWNGSSFTDQPISGDFVFFQMYERELSQSEIQSIYSNVKQDYGKIIEDGLVLNLDAGNYSSYFPSGSYWFDVSPEGNDPTLENGPTFESDPPAILFDGVDDYGTTNLETSSFQDGLTWAGWVRNDAGAAGGWEWMVGGTNQAAGQSYPWFQIGKQSSSEAIRFETGNFFSNTSLDSNQTVGDGNWHYLVGTVEDNGISITKNIYLDGVKGTSTTVVKSASPGDYGTIQIGHQQRTETTHTEYWEGAIAEVHLYTRGLTEAEVQYNFNARRGRYGI